jgi:hypothetical protein
MLMLTLFRFAAAAIPWTLDLATWLVARSLNMPEPVVHDTGAFLFAQVQTIENRVGRALCPKRLVRRLRSLLPR